MAKFAEYGFNKSHTAAYAVVSYQTAWLKAHHTSAFMAATLSSELDNTDQLKVFYEDTLANKVKVLGPDVNVSNYRFEPVSANTRSATAWARSRAPASRRSMSFWKRARQTGRSRTCSTSAGGATSASSTAAPSRRWSGPGPSTASMPTATSC